MITKTHAILTAALLAASSHAAQERATDSTARSSPATARASTESTPALERLQELADRLRQSIRAIAGQAPGPARDRAIAEAQQVLLRTNGAMLALQSPPGRTGTGAAHGSGGQAPSPVSGAGARAAVILLPDVEPQQRPLAEGCWVRFFDDKGFRGESVTLAGPVELPRMAFGDLSRKWESAIVGPKATVRTYDDENFRDRTALLPAGESIADLREADLGWFEEVKSARVQCSS